MFFWIATSVADAATVNPNEIESHLAVLSSFFINGKTAVINDLKKLRNPPS